MTVSSAFRKSAMERDGAVAPRAVEQVRARHQRLDRPDARPHCARQPALARRRGDRMNRRQFITLLGGAAAAWPLAARAQQTHGLITSPRVAFLGAESASTNQHFFDAFRQGMHEHGYVDGQNVTFVERWAEGRSERFPELIEELISLKADVILALSLPAALAAKSATTTVPIVFIASDPLGSGLVSSLARPAGNLTGFSLALGDEFSSKWLELLKEAVPSISRVAVLWNPVNPASSHYVTVLRDAAEKLGVRVQPQAVSDPDQFNGAFATIVAERAQALIVGGSYQALRDTGEPPDNETHWQCLAAPGRDAKSIRHRGTYKEDSDYAAYDAVAPNGGSFLALHDKPGRCPGPGW